LLSVVILREVKAGRGMNRQLWEVFFKGRQRKWKKGGTLVLYTV